MHPYQDLRLLKTHTNTRTHRHANVERSIATNGHLLWFIFDINCAILTSSICYSRGKIRVSSLREKCAHIARELSFIALSTRSSELHCPFLRFLPIFDLYRVCIRSLFHTQRRDTTDPSIPVISPFFNESRQSFPFVKMDEQRWTFRLLIEEILLHALSFGVIYRRRICTLTVISYNLCILREEFIYFYRIRWQ